MTAQRKDIIVKGYHTGAKARIKSVEGEYYGFEMEVDIPNRNMREFNAVVKNGNLPRSRYQLDAERDGSLMNSGVELITKRPLKVTEVRGKWMQSTLNRMVDEMGVSQGKQPSNYGLHINVNMAGIHIAEAVAFLGVLNFAMHTELVNREIMERGQTYSGLSNHLDFLVEYSRQANDRKLNKETIYDAIRKVHVNINKYMLPWSRQNYAGLRMIKTPIAEVRGFHMNTNIEAFKRKTDFVQRARRFANANTEMIIEWYKEAIVNQNNVLKNMTLDQERELMSAILNTPLKQELQNRDYNFTKEQQELVEDLIRDVRQSNGGRQLFTLSNNNLLKTIQ